MQNKGFRVNDEGIYTEKERKKRHGGSGEVDHRFFLFFIFLYSLSFWSREVNRTKNEKRAP